MRRRSRKIIAAGACLALLFGLLGSAAAVGKPPAQNDNIASRVFRVLHTVFRGVRGEVRRLGFAVQELRIELIDLDEKLDEIEVLNERIEGLEKTVLALEFGVADLAGIANILPPIADFNEQLRGCMRIYEGEIAGLPGPHVLFEACNVHVRSGQLATDAPTNGRGNLLVGYNEGRCAGDVIECVVGEDCPNDLVCSSDECKLPGGGRPNDVLCLSDAECPASYECDLSTRGGSHNLVVGDGHGYASFGGLVAGQRNRLSEEHASIVGGVNNAASGSHASVLGGYANRASGDFSTVSAGYDNSAEDEGASVSGGFENRAIRSYSSVSGGSENWAMGSGSAICGGFENQGATGVFSTISGGRRNVAAGETSSVSGGLERSVDGANDWRAGGQFEDE